MYSLKVEASFSAAHNLRGYKGKCEELHGHNWKVQIKVVKAKLDKIGMVLDFKYIKTKLNKVLEKLDHKYLNNIPYFKKVNPTSENIAKFIYNQVSLQGLEISSATVWENSSCSATYEE
jgi:6-pyruvoyltetrahydropterin/6-carboxytetrahydropterin synthase